jgi:hypothetical protein
MSNSISPSNCLIKNVTERMIGKGSLTHNLCYRIAPPKRRVDYESTVKKEYIEVTSLRYAKASRKKKSVILDQICVTCQCHRKHAIRILRSFKRFIKPNIQKRGRTPLSPLFFKSRRSKKAMLRLSPTSPQPVPLPGVEDYW